MLEISAESLKDFQVCGRYYDYRFNDGIEPVRFTRQKRSDAYGDSIRAVANFFFYKKQSYAEPSYQTLERRWEKLWFKDGTTAADIAGSRNEVNFESDISYATQASVSLMVFHEYFSLNPNTEVVLFDEPFMVPINNEIAIKGTFDVILREKKDGGEYRYHIYKWLTNNSKKPLSYWGFDFSMLAYAYSFRNKNAKDVHFYLWDFVSTEPKVRGIELEQDDIDSMIYWCKELAAEKTFPSKRGLTPYCKGCFYDRECKSWKVPAAEVKVNG